MRSAGASHFVWLEFSHNQLKAHWRPERTRRICRAVRSLKGCTDPFFQTTITDWRCLRLPIKLIFFPSIPSQRSCFSCTMCPSISIWTGASRVNRFSVCSPIVTERPRHCAGLRPERLIITEWWSPLRKLPLVPGLLVVRSTMST